MSGRRPEVWNDDPEWRVQGVSIPRAPATGRRVAAYIGLPYPPYLRKVIRRSAGMWVIVRCAWVAVVIGGMLFGSMRLPEALGAALHPGWSTRTILVAVATFLVWWDRRRFRELILHGNLGAHPGWFLGTSLLAASVLDIVVQTLPEVF